MECRFTVYKEDSMHIRTLSIILTATALAVLPFNLGAAEPPSDAPYVDGGRIVYPVVETEMQSPSLKTFDSSAKNFITRWLAPYRGANGTLDDDLIGEASVVPSCAGKALGGSATAQSASTSGSGYSDGRISMSHYQAPASHTDVVRYYLTQVESARARNVIMAVGADDGIRVWLNGDEVLRQDAPAEFVEGATQVPVSLSQGWNLLLVKVYYPQLGPQGVPEHEYKYWSLRFVEPDGTTPVMDVYQSVDGWCAPEDGYYGWAWAPGAADAAGARGSQWQSELRITNPYYHNLYMTLQYYANSNTSGIPDGERILRLESFETVLFDNVVRELTGTVDSGSGIIAVNGLYYQDVIGKDVARLVTANIGAPGGGAFGTSMPFGYLYTGTSCCSQQLYGLKNGPDNRTNLLVTPAPFVADEVVLTINLWDPESGRTASAEVTGRGSFQVNDIFGRVGMGDVVTDTAVAYVQYSPTASRAYIQMIASINDNVTSDPTIATRGSYGIPRPFQ
jgi:hypothetical protein